MIDIDTNTSVPPYPILILSALAAGLLLQYHLHKKRGIEKRLAQLSILSCIVFSIACGFGLTLLTSGFRFVGLSSMGGLLGMYLGNMGIGLLAKKNYYTAIMAENCTIVLPAVYSISKIGCFLAGCCEGIPYQGWGAVSYDHTAPVLPVQMIETIVFFILFLLGMVQQRKHNRNIAPILMVTASVTKGILDCFRASHIGCVVSVTQGFCVITAIIGLFWLGKRNNAVHHKWDAIP